MAAGRARSVGSPRRERPEIKQPLSEPSTEGRFVFSHGGTKIRRRKAGVGDVSLLEPAESLLLQ